MSKLRVTGEARGWKTKWGSTGAASLVQSLRQLQIAGIPDRRGSEPGDGAMVPVGDESTGLGSFRGNSSEFSVSRGFHREGVPLTGKVRREYGKTLKHEFRGPRVLTSGSGVPCGNNAIGALGLERPQSRWIDYASR